MPGQRGMLLSLYQKCVFCIRLPVTGFRPGSFRFSLSVLLLILSLSFLAGACKRDKGQEGSWNNLEKDESVSREALPPEPTPPPSGYILGTDDVIHILIYNEPDLTTVARIGFDGFIEMPLIGKVPANGLTQEELASGIETKLEQGYLVNPDVRVTLQEFRQNMVYLMGQVAVPGPYRITHGNTLMEMVSKAGGFSPIAKQKKVKIIRSLHEGSQTFYVDATRITDDGLLKEDIVLLPGDMIIVPERFF